MISCLFNSFGLFNDVMKVGPVKWPHFDLIFVHDGHLLLWPGQDCELELRTGQSVLIYPQTHFVGYSLAETTRGSVHHFKIVSRSRKNPEIYSRLEGRSNGYHFFEYYPGRQTERDLERLINSSHQQNDEFSEDMRDALMQLVLAALSRAPVPGYAAAGDTVFQELIRFLEDSVGRDVSLDEMAEVCGFSVSHFRVMFKRQFLETPGAYFQKLRMQSAGRKLRETTLPVKQIAQECGYGILPNFYRAFHGIFNMTPAEYRRQNLPMG